MFKTNIVVGLLMLALFTYAPYQGWNLFESTAASVPRQAAGLGRTYHK